MLMSVLAWLTYPLGLVWAGAVQVAGHVCFGGRSRGLLSISLLHFSVTVCCYNNITAKF